MLFFLIRECFYGFPLSAVDAAVVNPSGIKILLANGVSTFFINGRPTYINGPRNLPRNPPDCTILDRYIFDNFILVDELFAKTLRSFETCLSVSSDLCGKLSHH